MNLQDALEQKCAHCRKKLIDNPPVGCFYEVQVSQNIFNPQKTSESLGLAMIFGGNAKMADVFSPHYGMETELSKNSFILCQDCYMMKDVAIPLCQEYAGKDKEVLEESKT